MNRLAILSVHYLHPELLADQIERLARCAAPLRAGPGLALSFHPIVHRFGQEEVARGVLSAADTGGLAVRGIDLRDRSLDTIPEGGRSHGHSLSAAFHLLRQDGGLDDGDLIAILDHDTHPLDTRLFDRLAAEVVLPGGPAAVGIPHWHGPLCYLHPSLLLTRVETLQAMGTEAAFEVRLQKTPDDETWHDTSEGFTLWCQERSKPVLPLWVCSTGFPWSVWNGGEPELSGPHGEPVRLGHVMRFGLAPGEPLVSHLCAGPLGPFQYLGLSAHSWDPVLAAYLAEPLHEG